MKKNPSLVIAYLMVNYVTVIEFDKTCNCKTTYTIQYYTISKQLATKTPANGWLLFTILYYSISRSIGSIKSKASTTLT